jgi:hypothetical protein
MHFFFGLINNGYEEAKEHRIDASRQFIGEESTIYTLSFIIESAIIII